MYLGEYDSSAHHGPKYPCVGDILDSTESYKVDNREESTWRMEKGAQMMRTRMSATARLTRSMLTTVWRPGHVATDEIT